MTPRTTTDPEVALHNLRALAEVNGEIARAHTRSPPAAVMGEDVASVLSKVVDSAAAHRDELMRLINEWEGYLVRVDPGPEQVAAGSLVSAREIIESWLDIKEHAAGLYRQAAAQAPTLDMQRRLRGLAAEEEAHCARLRKLL